MPDVNVEFSFLFLLIAGVASLIASAFGIFAAAWGGLWTGPGLWNGILHLLLWLLPAFSVVAFGIYFLSRRIGLLASWATSLGSVITLYLFNLQDCLSGGCTTTNPFKIFFGVFLLPHLWPLLLASASLGLSARIANSSPSSPDRTGAQGGN